MATSAELSSTEEKINVNVKRLNSLECDVINIGDLEELSLEQKELLVSMVGVDLDPIISGPISGRTAMDMLGGML